LFRWVNIHIIDALHFAAHFVNLVGDVCTLAGSVRKPVLYVLCLTHTPALGRQVVVVLPTQSIGGKG
jgi:hypothetical protein